ncbi:DUF3558 family protein [Saccharothrix deserti]|uniref:DUF3558 family protein n=1 Tax=Saccharothrix deserti TaxID=2593674 RepID=UPI00131ACECE
MTVFGAVATGCTTGGTATPGTTGSTPTEQTSDTTSTKPSTGGGSLADFDTCGALNAVAPQLNLTEITPDDADKCDAEFSPTTSVALQIWPDKGLADVVTTTGEVSSTTVGSRKATMLKGSTTDESCLIAVEVTATSRVDVVGSSNNSQADSCDAVTKVATAIEPKLPK